VLDIPKVAEVLEPVKREKETKELLLMHYRLRYIRRMISSLDRKHLL
jgi:hypothetical protein